MKKLLFLLVTIIILVSFGTANALPVPYADRTTWETALGAPVGFLVDFNSFTEDASFQTVPLDVGPFTMAEVGDLQDVRNLVDVSPFVVGTGVDGSPHLNIFVNDGVSVTVTMTFDTPIYGWFGDFYAAGNTNELEMELVYDSGSNSIFVPGPGTGYASFGFIDTDIAYNQIIFQNVVNDGFALDNVAGAPGAPVPEPATMLLLGSGLIGFAGFRKRFRKG